jgi:hypothetical protein
MSQTKELFMDAEQLLADLDDGCIDMDGAAEMLIKNRPTLTLSDGYDILTRISQQTPALTNTDDWDEPDVDEAQEWHDFDPDC